VEPEEALRSSIAKFIKRFAFIEESLKGEGKTPEEATLEEMDRLWDISKSRDDKDS
jgi:ATP diphosphatase